VRYLARSLVQLCLSLGLAASLEAQQYAAHEISLGVIGHTTNTDVTAPYHLSLSPGAVSLLGAQQEQMFAGPAVRFDENLTSHFALEASMAYTLGHEFSNYSEGGHALITGAGVKAGWRGRRFGLYGRVLPGAIHFNDAYVFPNNPLQHTGATHFALEDGVALEAYPARRAFVRLDLSSLTLLEKGINDGPQYWSSLTSSISQHFLLGISAGYRFGSMKETPVDENRIPTMTDRFASAADRASI
jgi:hypothetical protein